MTECQKFTCSNPSCGKIFVNPIRAKNLALKESKPYYACPYCLTEIVLEGGASSIEKEQESDVREIKIEESSVPTIEEKSAQTHSEAKKCEHHFGYLSKRSAKEKIPEECMVCESIVQCMLMGVTG